MAYSTHTTVIYAYATLHVQQFDIVQKAAQSLYVLLWYASGKTLSVTSVLAQPCSCGTGTY
jgi:hypothetical protein